MKFKPGQFVTCVRGNLNAGLIEGEIYTVCVVLPGNVGCLDYRGNVSVDSVIVGPPEPNSTAEYRWPYVWDEDRFDEVKVVSKRRKKAESA